ncbi:MAG TPA: aminotransferase class IV [Planctomycetota bacterium]|nr:aminotransferase class IV [Planctomycetota bacterium]
MAPTQDMVVFLDGEPVALDAAHVSVFDHGFLFGDSVYEVVRTVRRRLFAFDPHMERLEGSARGLWLEIPWSRDELRAQVERAVSLVKDPGDAYVRIIITRGVGELDLAPDSCKRPGSVIIAKPLPVYPRAWYEDGIAVQIVGTMRNPTRAVSPSIKSGNYLNNVLALMEARRGGALEAAMLNETGALTECTTSNLFFARGGVVKTPALDCGILSGITRSILLDAARRAGVPIVEGSFAADELRSADEAFITSTTKDLVPIKSVDKKNLAASPGPLTKKLMGVFAREVQQRMTQASAIA